MCLLLHTLTRAFFSLSFSFLCFHAYGASAAPPLWKQLDTKQTTSILSTQYTRQQRTYLQADSKPCEHDEASDPPWSPEILY